MLENLSLIKSEENPLQIFNQLIPSSSWTKFLECEGLLKKIEILCDEDSKIEMELANFK